jgi:hypothetical protein
VNKNLTIGLSAAAALLGVASVVSTLANGGGIGSVGMLFGAILVAMGGMRIWITTRGSDS